MAVRSVLGASPRRIARQMIVESLVLSGVSGALGLVVAYALMQLIVGLAPADLPRIDEVRVNLRMMSFTLAIAVLAGMVFGLVPAWRSSRTDPMLALRAQSRSASATRESVRLRALLVASEVAICVVALVVGGLLLKSFTNVLRIPRGFMV